MTTLFLVTISKTSDSQRTRVTTSFTDINSNRRTKMKPKFGRIFEIYFFLVLPIFSEGSDPTTTEVPDHAENTQFEYSSGIVLTETEQTPFFYESFVPLIFHYGLPKFSVESLQLSTYRSVTDFVGLCDKSKFNYKCPTWFYMDTLLKDQFSSNLTWWQSSKNATISPPSKTGIDFCSDITDHFPNTMLTTEEDFEENYMNRFLSCGDLGELSSKQEVGSYSTTALQDFYDDMSRSTGDAYWILPSKVDAAASLNMQLATYAVFLLNQHMESNRWKDAYEICKSGTIPSTILSQSTLATQLKKLVTKLKPKYYDLSIPSDDIDSYFKPNMKLADCVFAGDYFVLRLLLPVFSKKSQYQWLKYSSVPFIGKEKGDLCYYESTSANINNKFIFRKNKKLWKVSDCKAKELCRVAHTVAEYPFEEMQGDRCISTVLAKNDVTTADEELIKACPLRCVTVPPETVTASKISSDKVALASARPTTFQLECDGHTEYKENEITTRNYGVLQVTVPCGCSIIQNEITYFRSASPCQNRTTTELKHLVHVSWTQSGKTVEFSTTTAIPYSNTKATPSYSSTATLAVTPVPRQITTTTEKIVRTTEKSYHPHSDHKTDETASGGGGSSTFLFSLLFIFFVILSCVFAALAYKVYILEKIVYKDKGASDDTQCIVNGSFYESPGL